LVPGDLGPSSKAFLLLAKFCQKEKLEKIENEVLLGGFKSPELRKK
jgi:hypothetical protein